MLDAARIADNTEHQGVISKGSLNVTIGGRPAARVLDYHVCPDETAGAPHVGGPIVFGSATVLINGRMAARKGDGLLCMGSASSDDSPKSTSGDGVDVGHDRDKKFGQSRPKEGLKKDPNRYGRQKFTERGDNLRNEKDPVLNVNIKKIWAEDSGELETFWGEHGKLGSGSYEVSSEISAEFNNISDFRAKISPISLDMHATGVELSTGEQDLVIGTVEATAKVLNAEATAEIGMEFDAKKREAFVGAQGELGVALVEGEVSGKSKPLRIPFTDWGISFEAGASGSLLAAQIEGHAGARISKHGFEARFGGKVGAFLAGVGFNLGMSIAPLDPPKIPMDFISSGSPSVRIGS